MTANNIFVCLLVAGLIWGAWLYLRAVLRSYREIRAAELQQRAQLAFKRIAYIGRCKILLREALEKLEAETYGDNCHEIKNEIREFLKTGKEKHATLY